MFKPEAIRRHGPYLARRFQKAHFFMRLVHRWRRQWEFGKALIDRAGAGLRGNHCTETNPKDIEAIARIFNEGKGLILLSAHVGNWQLSMSTLPPYLPAPLNVVLYRDAGDMDRHYFEHRGESAPFRVIDPADGPMSAVTMAQTLLKGGILAMMGDRPFGDAQNCRVSFFGETINLPYTPYYLASVTGAPVVIFFSYRNGPMKVLTTISRILRIPTNLGKDPVVYEPYARHFAEALEETTDKHPYQFFNFYDMWGNSGHQKQT